MRALLLGATGLVGGRLLPMLLGDDFFREVVVVARRPTGVRHTKLVEHVFDLEEMEQHGEAFDADQIFCALGTTIKAAGSQERFRIVDHDYPLRAAKLGLARGAHHYLLVSATGANRRSRIFYSRVKGELEDDVLSLGYRSVTIARPSLLAGPRREPRLGERFALAVGWLFPPKWRPVPAEKVARALVLAAKADEPGVHVLESRELNRWEASIA
jgi:uncharacterized protein YbjT (DUF2867 family)